MLRHVSYGLVFLGLAGCVQAQAPQNAQGPENDVQQAKACLVEGRWVNERGSMVTFSCRGERLSGFYNTNVGQADKGEGFPLTGWIEGDNLSFSVNFKGYGSITAWVGQLERVDDKEVLKTLWHLTRDVDDMQERDDMWKSVTSGASLFVRPAP